MKAWLYAVRTIVVVVITVCLAAFGETVYLPNNCIHLKPRIIRPRQLSMNRSRVGVKVSVQLSALGIPPRRRLTALTD